MQQRKKISPINIVSALVFMLIAVAVYWLYNNAKAQLLNDSLNNYQKKISHEITGLIDDSREASMVVALSLSESNQVHDFLKQDFSSSSTKSLNFDKLLEQISLQTHNDDLWIQIIDTKGVSRYRSWTKRVGDSIYEARSDVKEVLKTPQILKSISVGKFNLTFKSMVPLFDKSQKLLGIVEVISHVSPLSLKLKKLQNISSIVLVDKHYKEQLLNARKNRFLDDYYIANEDIDWHHVQTLEELGVNEFPQLPAGQVVKNQIITKYEIHDDAGLVVGYWFTFKPLDALTFTDVEQLNRQYLYGSVALLVLTLFIMVLYIFKKSSDKSLRYYQYVLDSASEIVFVSNYSRIKEANQQFFDFYSEFSNVDEFVNKYDCVCDTFLKKEGFLQKEQDGEYWLDYVLKHPEKRHKVQIKKGPKIHYFEIKVALITLYEKPLYSVIMHDITSEEEYRQKLEYLSETDTLTGISNRLVFNRTLANEVHRAHRYQLDLSIMIFDVDFFKKVNDTYGHEVGDQVLITLGQEVSKLLREIDVLCRIGGEEFTVIMPETNLEKAEITAERLRKSIETLPEDTLPTHLTVSFGVAYMTRWDNDKTLLKRADEALYKAKENGRNRVEVADNQQVNVNS
ncbi:diguanylate cyclase [Thiomicrorhabdus sp.]|uniref:sensor domain-containing diguanylate cyclase n=1 Tax=Thiomicrorhabdus sp. TaxID=2039724 RepID=UPI002AA718AD|nr:diguanylate cyclase [Thiomicrorhabdus sp.]